MSLSSDVKDAFSKPRGMHLFSENHPVLMVLGAMTGILAGLVLVTSFLMR